METTGKLLCALLLVCGTSVRAGMLSGNDLHGFCQQEDVICDAYIVGAIDTMIDSTPETYAKAFSEMGIVGSIAIGDAGEVPDHYSFCWPRNAQRQQLVDTVKQYLVEMPEERHKQAPLIVFSALAYKFPCG